MGEGNPKTICEVIAEGLGSVDGGGRLSDEHVAATQLANAADDLLNALCGLLDCQPEIQGGICIYCGWDYWRKDDLDAAEGDMCVNPECPAVIARAAISKARGES